MKTVIMLTNQPGLDRYVAVKVLPSYYAHEEGFAQRFVREAKAIARLDHPNILPVYDFGQDDGLSYIVMKYVAGGTLKDRLGGALTVQETLPVLRQIAAIVARITQLARRLRGRQAQTSAQTRQ